MICVVLHKFPCQRHSLWAVTAVTQAHIKWTRDVWDQLLHCLTLPPTWRHLKCWLFYPWELDLRSTILEKSLHSVELQKEIDVQKYLFTHKSLAEHYLQLGPTVNYIAAIVLILIIHPSQIISSWKSRHSWNEQTEMKLMSQTSATPFPIRLWCNEASMDGHITIWVVKRNTEATCCNTWKLWRSI